MKSFYSGLMFSFIHFLSLYLKVLSLLVFYIFCVPETAEEKAGTEACTEAGTEAGSEAGTEAGTKAITKASTEASMKPVNYIMLKEIFQKKTQ